MTKSFDAAAASIDKLLDVAAGLFRRKGFAATTVREIASAAGMLPGSLHYRYASKEALLVSLMERAIARLTDGIREAVSTTRDPAERLRLALRAHLRILLSDDDAVYVMLYDWRAVSSDTARDAIIRLRDTYEAFWDGLIFTALVILLVSALLFASRAGSSITAEIGLMKATEQLTAMDMMAVNPIARVVAPRFWGGVISMPLLAALFSSVGVFGGYLIGVVFIGVDEGAFWSQMQGSVDFRFDVWNGIVKSFVFGVAVSLIAVFEGYDATPTAEGVSSSIKRTVVYSALAILALDFVLTSFMFRGM